MDLKLFKKTLFGIFIFALISAVFNIGFVRAGEEENQQKLEINFFYSKKCPYCGAEQKFLDEIEKNIQRLNQTVT